MPFVLDASIAMAWCFEDEATEYADYVLASLMQETAIAPAIWPLEVANALWMGQRRGRMTRERLARILATLRPLPVVIAPASLELALDAVLPLARDYGLTSYDASYIELARREGLALASQDARLRAAAQRCGVALVPHQPAPATHSPPQEREGQ
jgi:predicted nucleic acid-binding protein